MDGCFQFLAPAGRHVYSSASAPEERYVYSSDTLIFRAPEEPWEKFLAPAGRHVYSMYVYSRYPEERNVYHASASSSESKTYFGCIEQCHRPSFAPTERDMYNGRLFPVFSPSGATCL